MLGLECGRPTTLCRVQPRCAALLLRSPRLPRAACPPQIFSSVECFRILSEELFRIQNARSPSLAAEATDDDVRTLHPSRMRGAPRAAS